MRVWLIVIVERVEGVGVLCMNEEFDMIFLDFIFLACYAMLHRFVFFFLIRKVWLVL